MAFQSSIRTSVVLVKLSQCGRVRTFASSRPEKPPTFSEVQQFRRKQAKRSLLVQVSSVQSSDLLGSYLGQYGTINSLFHCTKDKKEFLFVEMSSADEVEAVLRCACQPYRHEVVPVTSPLLWLRSGGPLAPATSPPAPQHTPPAVVTGTALTTAALCREITECPSLDEQLVRYHELTRLTELGARLRYFTCELLERALTGLFPTACARPFGSSANGFGRHDCDVDLVLQLAPEAEPDGKGDHRLAFQNLSARRDGRTQTQRYLNFLGDMLLSLMPGCSQVRRILKAKVPIVKYTQSLTGIDCDLSMDRTGLHMTELLYVWSQLDTRVPILARVVRDWAEKVHLTNCVSGSGRFISNFGLTLLVIHFLQTRPVPILPSVNELTQLARPGDIAEVGDATYAFLRNPSLAPVSANTESLSDLLAAFFALYAELDLNAHALSVVWAGRFSHPGDAPLHVQNPLNLELNVTKNVSREEVCRLGREADRAARLLESGRWWELLLGEGVPQTQPRPISVRGLFEEEGDGAKEGRQVEDSVKLASLLGGEAAAAGRRGTGPAAFSGLRLTVDGETPGAERTAVPAVSAAAAAAAGAAGARDRKAAAAAAAAAARQQRTATQAMAILDATSGSKPQKRKKKRKGSQAGR